VARLLMMVLILSISAACQDRTGEFYNADCTYVSSVACKSFNEMMRVQDRDLAKLVNKENRAYVCFRDSEDVFFVVSRSLIENVAFFKYNSGKPPGKTKARNSVSTDSNEVTYQDVMAYSRFEDGILTTFKFWPGAWKKNADEPIDSARFESPASGGVVYEDSSALHLSFPFKNIGGTVTRYSLSIRMSTLRFVETMEAPSKGKGAVQTKLSGRCVAF